MMMSVAFLTLGSLPAAAAGGGTVSSADPADQAAELMTAMLSWVEERQVNPGDLDPTTIEEFTVWVRDREEVSGNTASLQSGAGRTW